MRRKLKNAVSLASAAVMTAAAFGTPAAPIGSSSAANTSFPYTIEGEDMEGATLWTSIYETQCPGYSGEGFTYITNNSASFTVTVPDDGMYELSAMCIQILDDSRLETITVNGVEYSKNVPRLSSWTKVDFGTIRLKKGENEIAFISKYGYVAIDTVTVKEAEFPDIKLASDTPCDPKATPETRSLMKYLHSVYGTGILSGQQEIYGGGHGVSTTIRYDQQADKCVDSDGNEYVIDRDSLDTDKDGNKFYWHCSDDKRVYTYDSQNRNYKYDYYDQEFDAYKDMTGEYPAIRGLDLMNYNPLYGWDDGSTERAIDWVKNRNGIITASWHINIPQDFDNYTLGTPVDWTAATYKPNHQFKIANAVKKGTKENDYLNLAIEDLAEQLQKLQDNNVPIMFRPFHEAEGNGGLDGSGAWFWWSQDGAEVYKELWKYLYDKLTNEYELHNIIWLQNLYAWSDESGEWYAGDDYVDIVGFDKYDTVYHRHDGKTSGPNEDCNSMDYWSIHKFVDGNKMIGIMENSTIPSLSNLTTEKATWLYFCTWYDNGQDNFLTGDNYNNAATIKELGSSDYCINLEDLPADLYTAGGSEHPTSGTTGGTTDGDVLYGDANCDGKVTIADAVFVMQSLALPGKYQLSALGEKNADVAGKNDGITNADALAIQKFMLGLIKELPDTK